MSQKRLRYASQYQLPDPCMGEATHDNEIDSRTLGILAQSFGHIAVAGADGLGLDLNLVGEQMLREG